METSLKKGKSAIYSSILNYGLSNFKLEILEYCSDISKKCVKLEQIYLDLLKPEYNILKISGSSLGVICSEETRAKISASNLGKTRSKVTRAKMSASQMGNTNGQNHPNSIKIEVTDLELNTKTIYKSMRAGARALNINVGIITKYFCTSNKQYKKTQIKGAIFWYGNKIALTFHPFSFSGSSFPRISYLSSTRSAKSGFNGSKSH
jgi:group I intron endonuclease